MAVFFPRRIIPLLVTCIFLLFFITPAYASCGSIFEFSIDDDDAEPIEDCDNPFGIVDENPDITVSFGDVALEEGGVYDFLDQHGEWGVDGSVAFSVSGGLYRHVDEGYVLKDRITFAETDFTFTEPGTYSVVIYEEDQIQVSQNALQKKFFEFLDWLVPPALAFEGPSLIVTFSVIQVEEEELEAPPGASSVLFLPGIQASRLYRDGMLSEDQIWTPTANFGQDVGQLEMTDEGVSVETIYTRDVIDSVVGLGNIYGGFLEFLEDLETAELPIREHSAFAYDWRFSVADIVADGTKYEDEMRDLVEEVERLSADSYTGSTTIVAHSNGGLLAKALLIELEEQGKEELVDRVVFVAVPQLGTPKAIGSVLHGYDQTAGLTGIIMEAHGAREVMNNFPGVYGLLPTEKYFDLTNDPLITFQDGESTDTYSDLYGTSISDFSPYVGFLRGQDGLDRALSEPVSTPATANESMLESEFSNHKELYDDWEAPAHVEIVEIVGSGLPTMRGIEYRTLMEIAGCVSAGPGPALCVEEPVIKPYAYLTTHGDGTVVQSSAEAYEGEKQTFYIDMKFLEGISEEVEYRHANIMEVDPLQELLTSVLMGSVEYDDTLISESTPNFEESYDIKLIDSPVRLLAVDSEGNRTGSVVEDDVVKVLEEIPGSQYFEFGDTKYLVIPSKTDHTTTLYGEASGWYTFTTATLNAEDEQEIVTALENATTTPTMVATLEKEDGEYSDITVDYENDGVPDAILSLTGSTTVLGVNVPPEDEESESEPDDVEDEEDVSSPTQSSGGRRGTLVNHREREELAGGAYEVQLFALIVELRKLVAQLERRVPPRHFAFYSS